MRKNSFRSKSFKDRMSRPWKLLTAFLSREWCRAPCAPVWPQGRWSSAGSGYRGARRGSRRRGCVRRERPQALERGGGLDQGAVDAEVLATEQLMRLGLLADLREEGLGDGRREQALAVLGEARRVKERLRERQAHEGSAAAGCTQGARRGGARRGSRRGSG